ncbi:hypothetical protein BDW62DRAFT_159310 [Aspergillus aurantiobrunneus]
MQLPDTIDGLHPFSTAIERNLRSKTYRKPANNSKPPPNAPNIAKPRKKVLLADTIGQSLCLRRTHLSPTNEPPTLPHIQDLVTRLQPDESLSPWLSVPVDRHGPYASTSSETLTENSYDTALWYSSNTSGESEKSGSAGVSDKGSPYNRIVSLGGKPSEQDVERLATEYGLPSQMGLLDPSYHVFINQDCTAGLCFKVLNRVAVIIGDPMCELGRISNLLREFKEHRRRKHWGMSVLGAGEPLAQYARENKRWTVLRFGKNQVLNPLTNEVIHETSGKRILTQARQLLNPAKGGLTLDLYIPSLHGTDYKLENHLGTVYEAWRGVRNASCKPQAFITEYDPFMMPNLMTYIYSRDLDGTVNGFTALRWVGAKGGFHVDPCIAAPGAQRGISDLLLFASMAYSRQLGISYLGVGYEPSESISGDSKLSSRVERLTSRLYRYTYWRLPLMGKGAYFKKFKPDAEEDSPVYLIFCSKIPGPRQGAALLHVAHISLRRLLLDRTAED